MEDAMKSILVTASGGAADSAVFATALAAARPFGAHLEFFHLRVGLGEAARHTPHVAFARGAGLRHALAELRVEDEARSEAARSAFAAFCTQFNIPIAARPTGFPGVTASLSEESGDAAEQLAHAARHRDLVVLGRHTHADDLPPDFVDHVLLRSGRPVLLAPAKRPVTLTGTIMVCWKETPEAARALTAALPLLAKSRHVVIANVHEHAHAASGISDVVRHLAWHDIDADVRRLNGGTSSAGERLAAAARECTADLIVMGAYGHSRMRQLFLGGCTQYFLENATATVLFMH
jgi:nucleotide-binding universal stress UspA family protein